MKLTGLYSFLTLVIFAGWAKNSAAMNAPSPKKIPHTHEIHGDRREDPYYWLKNRGDKDVTAYLKSENAYTTNALSGVSKEKAKIFRDLKALEVLEDSTYPTKDGNYLYYRLLKKGKEHPIWYRTDLKGKNKQILIDLNKIPSKVGYKRLGDYAISPDQNWLAYTIDFAGDRRYTLFFKHIKTGKLAPFQVRDADPSISWISPTEVAYTTHDIQTLRSNRFYVYEFSFAKDGQMKRGRSTLHFEEKDEIMDLGVLSSSNQQSLFVMSQNISTSEVRIVDLRGRRPGDPIELRLFKDKKPDLEYSIEDGGDRFFILTNENAQNFMVYEVMKSDFYNSKRPFDFLSLREVVVKHRKDVYISAIYTTENHLILQEQKNGLTQIEILDRKAKRPLESAKIVEFPEEVYEAGFGDNREYSVAEFRIRYSSLSTPVTTYDVDLSSGKLIFRKSVPIPKPFSSKNYVTKREWIESFDKTAIPVSMVYRRDTKISPETPLLLYAYGSYGISIDPGFISDVIPLLDREFVFAIAHIRGGSEMGKDWYDQAKMLKKKTTFQDFVEVTKGLHKKGVSSPRHTFAKGGSAGGLLMGAIANMAPELYRGIIAQVPFVDVLTTMLDPTLPLTTGEYNVWGNPNEKKYYDYIRTYSPVDNVSAKPYPAIYAVVGYYDSQVPYWEAAKWLLKIREQSTAKEKALLRVEMKAGHGGKAGRFERLKDFAEQIAFLVGREKGEL